MAAELIVVEGATLKFKDPTHSGTIVIGTEVGPPPALPSVFADKVKSGGNRAFLSIGFAVSGFAGGGVSGGIGVGTIVGTSEKAKSLASFVVEDDEISITVTAAASPFNSTTTTVVVDNPGQSVVRVQ